MNLAEKLFHPGVVDCGEEVREIAWHFYLVVADEVIAACEARNIAADRQIAVPGDALLRETGEACWIPELGVALELARHGGEAVKSALGQLLLCNASVGMAFTAELDICPVSYLQFAGLRLARTARLGIESDGIEVVIVTDDLTYRFENKEGRWECADFPCLLRTYLTDPLVMLTGGNCLDMAVSAPDDVAIAAADFDGAAGEIQDAFSFIREVTPEYTHWTRRLIRRVHILGDTARGLKVRGGRSSPTRPGLITTTIRLPVERQAEELIHESSHQHFYLFQLLNKLPKNGGGERRFISPLNGKSRDISRYLLAYHVVANMAIFYTRLSGNNSADQIIVQERKKYLKPIAKEYLDTLKDNADLLTDEANGFWIPSSDYITEVCAGL